MAEIITQSPDVRSENQTFSLNSDKLSFSKKKTILKKSCGVLNPILLDMGAPK